MPTNPTETSKHIGRPSLYSEELAERICIELASGRSLTSICASEDWAPDKVTVLRWLRQHVPFRTQYTQAREDQAEVMADEMNDIADDGTNDWMERELRDGTTVEVPNHEHINRSRLRVDTRKWIAARLLPKKYGDRVVNEVTGKDGGPIRFEVGTIGADVTKG